MANGLPAFTIVGLPDAALNETKERVPAAIRNSGTTFPLKRITVNLAPADLRKEGPSYDLPMAVGVMRAGEQVIFDDHADNPGCLFLGELGLDGILRDTNGILPMVALARQQRHRHAVRASSGRVEGCPGRGGEHHLCGESGGACGTRAR
jgi:magnesium chelatase family protein